MKYIKLTDLAKLVRMFYDTEREDIFDQEFWDSFVERFPSQVVESIPVENKEREELLMVAAHIVGGINANNTDYDVDADKVIELAQNLITARNAACEKKEDNK